jgi:hypothetical protein
MEAGPSPSIIHGARDFKRAASVSSGACVAAPE